MTDGSLQRRADRLAARVQALARALCAGGVPEEVSAELLSHASAAVLQALQLELLIEGPELASEPANRLEPDIRLAA